MMVEIIRELTKSEENKDVTSSQVLLWQVETQRTHQNISEQCKSKPGIYCQLVRKV